MMLIINLAIIIVAIIIVAIIISSISNESTTICDEYGSIYVEILA